MATAIPPALRAADIARFAQRAGQVEKARPAVAYWCNYWVVDRIIANGLHKADDDCKSYTVQLMDKLEQIKNDFAENDAIIDDMAGHAYVEQFGQETFRRADNAMRANKASRQTADTFQAAATFLELCQIWGPLDPEVASKIKFAKYHALRIAKAIKAGEDPNTSNPHPESSPSIELPPLDKDDPEVQKLNGSFKPDLQPSVEEVPEDQSLQPSLPSKNPNSQREYFSHSSAAPEVSPLAPSGESPATVDGGEYFPKAPDAVEMSMHNSTVPENTVGNAAPSSLDSLHHLPPQNLDNLHPSPSLPASKPIYQSQPGTLPHSGSQLNAGQLSSTLSPTAHLQSVSSNIGSSRFRDDEAAIAAAQKHAKFAISALNFEDVKTAVTELEEALKELGAR